MKRKPLTLAGRIVHAIVVLVALLWVIFPFYWAFLNSIKKTAEIFRPTWIPWLQFTPTLDHWTSELAIPETRQAFLNSILISMGAATLATILGTMAAYALARFHFTRPSNGSFTIWFISQRIMPPVLFVIPVFLLMRQFNLLDSVWGLILLNATFNLPLPVIILSQMFRELPAELEDAACIDGASRFQSFILVALPLVAPGLIAAWTLCLAFSWNEFLFALALANKSAIPMPISSASVEGTRGVQFHYVGVRVLLTMLPPTILALLAQRYIVRGLTLGAVKE
ncbi:MAG: binding-protein-dependent transport systems inner membrane component [Chloroflexota bacterium]|nr:MAG: binding-protein-dependent transport systems inner membrane component [Chloroflexota bacterium]